MSRCGLEFGRCSSRGAGHADLAMADQLPVFLEVLLQHPLPVPGDDYIKILEAYLEVLSPPRVKFFNWLACLDRCWTGEWLARHRLPHPTSCPLCDQSVETMAHIFTGCPFSRTIWYEALSWIRSTCRPPVSEDDFLDWWLTVIQSTPSPLRKGTSPVYMLTAWWIWKHCNTEVFNNARPPGLVVRCGVRPFSDLYRKSLFYQCIEMQSFLRFREKKGFR
jgi:hypothetical protein